MWINEDDNTFFIGLLWRGTNTQVRVLSFLPLVTHQVLRTSDSGSKRTSNPSVLVCVSAQSCPTLCDPTDRTARGYSPWLLCPWDSPGKNTGVVCHFPLQGIFQTQGSNWHLLCPLHRRQILYLLNHWATEEVGEVIGSLQPHQYLGAFNHTDLKESSSQEVKKLRRIMSTKFWYDSIPPSFLALVHLTLKSNFLSNFLYFRTTPTQGMRELIAS